ncbi:MULTISPECIES: hypothetical protein [Cryobacterium]|uniref:hypothetical protein n=1 Tax=Cryobacterium TaxID=69578 RepID=UPI00141B5D9E|nr:MULTISPECIES: hypothetical protein [Cryobacterium]
MTVLTPVLDPMNGLDNRPALPKSAARGSELQFSADLTEVIAIWVAEIAVHDSKRSS